MMAIPKARRKWIWLAAALVLLAAAATAWLYIGSTRVVVTARQVELPGLARADDGLRVAVLSDPHFGPGDAGRAAMLADRLNRLDPDLIVLLGDFVDGIPDRRKSLPLAELTRFAASLRSRCGVFAVTGNHELWYGRHAVVEALRQGGVTVLRNEVAAVATPSGRRLQIVGLPDYTTEPQSAVFPPVAPGIPTVILMHDPRSAEYVPENVRGFILAGHTHGGQLRLIPNGSDRTSLRLAVLRLRSKLGLLPPDPLPHVLFDRWFTEYRGRRMFITSGAGLSRLRLRLFCPPEVALIEFRTPGTGVNNNFMIPEEL